jgi:hypothetical protein
LVPLRPSSEHILIVRAPGARDQHGCHSTSFIVGALRARKAPRRSLPLLSLLVFSSLEGGLLDLPLRATFSPAHPLARRDVPSARARALRFPIPLFRGVAKAALYCAHRTSTVSPCAFCEQEGHLAAPLLYQPNAHLCPFFSSSASASLGPQLPAV